MNTEITEKIKSGEQLTYNDLEQLDHLVLEYACTGNSGRSPMAEAIANEYIMDKGIEGVLAISSGTKRNANMEGKSIPSIDNQLFVIGRAMGRNDELGIYSPAEAEEVAALLGNKEKTKSEYASDSKVFDAVRQYDDKGRTRLVEEEHEFRDRAAKEIGLKVPIKKGGQQTVPCSKVSKFYAMGESNEEDARVIYEGTTVQPVFDNFGIPNTFGLPYDQYKEMVVGLKDQVIKTVETASVVYESAKK